MTTARERERARLTAFLWLLLLLGGRLGFVWVTLELASLWHPGSRLLSGSLERERERDSTPSDEPFAIASAQTRDPALPPALESPERALRELHTHPLARGRMAPRDIRVALIGDEGVGKSSIISALIKSVSTPGASDGAVQHSRFRHTHRLSQSVRAEPS